VGGSGGLYAQATGDGDAVYNAGGFDFSQSGENLTLSMMVYVTAGATGGSDKFQLGMCYSTNTPYGGAGAYGTSVLNEFASYRLLTTAAGSSTYTLEYQYSTGGGANTQTAGLQNVALSANEWYQMNVYYVNNGNGTLTMSTALYDYGANGTTPGALVNTGYADAVTITSDLTSDTTTDPGFRNANTTGITYLDNLSLVESVPEPSSCALAGLGICTLLGMGRWRRNK
jgi:hypothetical protein